MLKSLCVNRWIGLSILIALLDRLSKFLAVAMLQIEMPTPVFLWLNFYLTYNSGAAFGILAQAGGWQRWVLSGFSLMMSGLIVYQLKHLPPNTRVVRLAFSLVLGGSLGNLYDRIQCGMVVDFIDFHIGNWHFPTFNIADSMLFLGAVFWIFAHLRDAISQKV